MIQSINLPDAQGAAEWSEEFLLLRSLSEQSLLPCLALDGRAYAAWLQQPQSLQPFAAACAQSVQQAKLQLPYTSAGWMLLDTAARIPPLRLAADADETQWQSALNDCFSTLRQLPVDAASLLIVPGPEEGLLWGDVCNCEPVSGSELAVAVRALVGEPGQARALSRPQVEYYFQQASLQQGEALLLGCEGRRLLPPGTAGELARKISGLQQQRAMRLFWLQAGDACLFWGAAKLEVRGQRVRKRGIYRLLGRGEVLAEGIAIGRGIVCGKVCSDKDAELTGEHILVVDSLDPSWVGRLEQVGGIVSRRGGRTSHAALIAAEYGIPTLVGCPLPSLAEGTEITLNCEQANKGQVLKGAVEFKKLEVDLKNPPPLSVDIMLDMANPYRAYQHALEPNRGIGLARLEFIVSRMVGIHPRALLEPDRLEAEERRQLQERTLDYSSPEELYVEKLCQGIATLAVVAGGNPVMLRLSDFKSDEYARLLGGRVFEPSESNPMLGLRGASRYLQHEFQPCLEMECRAVKKVREEMGMRQVSLLIPFVRTPEEAQAVLDLLAGWGLKRGEAGLQIHMMCELPSNLILAGQFAPLFDGFSIGTNDLTQLMLGVDRNSPMVAHLFEEGHAAVLNSLEPVIAQWREEGRYISVCGRGVSDNFPFALWFARRGVNSLTVDPGRAADLWLMLHEKLQEEG